jgi:hypothetical protein
MCRDDRSAFDRAEHLTGTPPEHRRRVEHDRYTTGTPASSEPCQTRPFHAIEGATMFVPIDGELAPR